MTFASGHRGLQSIPLYSRDLGNGKSPGSSCRNHHTRFLSGVGPNGATCESQAWLKEQKVPATNGIKIDVTYWQA